MGKGQSFPLHCTNRKDLYINLKDLENGIFTGEGGKLELKDQAAALHRYGFSSQRDVLNDCC